MRIVFALVCALVAPLALRAQAPSPGPAVDPALAAAVKLERMTQAAAPSARSGPAILADAVATDSKAKRRSTGKWLMIGGGAAIVTGAIVGGGGGAALIVTGILAGGYGFWMFNGQ